MTYPTVPLTNLSEDAQRLYAARASAYELVLDRDWLAPDAHRMSAHALRKERQLDPEFTPSEKLVAACEELVAAGYATPSSQSRSKARGYYLTSVDQKHYTAVVGDGPWRVTVRASKRPGVTSVDARVLAVLDGAVIDSKTFFDEHAFSLRVRIPGAYDEEHSSAYSAAIDVLLPTYPRLTERYMRFSGVAGDVHLYPMGTDPLLLDAEGREPIDEPQWCTYDQCQKKKTRHMIAPYLPPSVDDLTGRFLLVEAVMLQTGKEPR